MGRYYILNEQPDQALVEFQRWKLLQPRDPEPLFYIGWAYDLKADIAADANIANGVPKATDLRRLASNSYRMALEVDPKHAESLNALGLEAEVRGDSQSACKYYAGADRSKADDPTFLANLGNCSTSQKKYSDAFQYYERALRLDPQFAGGWWNYGLAVEDVPDGEAARCKGLASCLRTNEIGACRRQELRRAYETAVSLRLDFPDAIIELARALRSDGQPAAAGATVSEAIAILERDVAYPNRHAKARARAYETRCLAEEDQRLWDQALTDCKLAAQLDPAKKSFDEHASLVAKEKETTGNPGPH